jgi:hypothetical protein
MTTKKITLNELRTLVKELIKEEHTKPIVSDMLKNISNNKDVVKFNNKLEFNNILKKQNYFNASYSHCYYSIDDYIASQKGDKRFRKDSQGISEADRGCVLLFNSGDVVAVWSEKDSIGYIIPSKK